MKKLLLFFFVIAFSHSITKAQCPPGAQAIGSLYPQCGTGCVVLLLDWPEGSLVNIYGGSPLAVVAAGLIPGTLGGGGIGSAYICVPCNIPLIFASASLGASSGCVIITGGVLPVKLTDFSAISLTATSCLLKWTASEEAGNVKYIIQKSDNGRDFNNIKTIAAYNNGKASNSYSFEDAPLVEGNKYYRIKIIEASGSTSYSPVVIVKNKSNSGFSIYPNPVLNNFSVTIAEKILPATVEIYNAQGQPVYSFKTKQSLLNINKELSKGIYALKVTGNNNISATQKFIKQ
jgi:hypothetical protein